MTDLRPDGVVRKEERGKKKTREEDRWMLPYLHRCLVTRSCDINWRLLLETILLWARGGRRLMFKMLAALLLLAQRICKRCVRVDACTKS